MIRPAALALLVLSASVGARAEEPPPATEAREDAPPVDAAAPSPAAAPVVAPTVPLPVVVPAARAAPQSLAELRLQPDDSWIRLALGVEMGALSVASHTIRFGQEGSTFDYVRDGGQDNLFPFMRASLDATFFAHHTVVALYQPLTVETDVTLARDLRVFDTTFAAGTPMRLKYGFDFVRLSYLYDFFEDPKQELSIGASLQLRDAVIDFGSADGKQLASNRNLGPVPILKGRGRYTFDSGAFLGAEVDGFWASGRIITGTLNDFEGAILDASVRAGLPLTGFSNVFVNLRYLGGGARGTEEDADREGDGFAENWLHTVALTFGAELR